MVHNGETGTITWLDEQDGGSVERLLDRFRLDPNYRDYMSYAQHDERFALWLRLVDKIMVRLVGLTHRDIGDWTWADAFYDSAMGPTEAAREALENDDTYQVFFGGRFE